MSTRLNVTKNRFTEKIQPFSTKRKKGGKLQIGSNGQLWLRTITRFGSKAAAKLKSNKFVHN